MNSPLDTTRKETILAKLKPADLEYGPQVSECMEGTRRYILANVEQWVADFNAPNILWLKGHPGVGKSAIAASVVESLRAKERFGCSFFFQRQQATTMTPNTLWLTVAYDLARRYPAIATNIIATLNRDEAIPVTVDGSKLFRQFIEEPLRASEEIPVDRSPVVVIDALDECGGLEGPRSTHRISLAQTIERWSRLPHKFKLFVTSRSESDIERLFSTTGHQVIEIQTVEEQSSRDINMFLTHQLKQIALQHPRSLSPNWPGAQDVMEMTSGAAGLFIWAKTVVKFISEGSPEERLEMVLGGSGVDTLYKLYEQILSVSFGNRTANEIRNLRSVVGAILLAKTPLSSRSLAALLSLRHSVVENICNGLQSVLDPGDILRFHHQSFTDFLLDPARSSSQFFIEQERETRNLTMACLTVMKRELKFNVCGLESSYVRNIDVVDLASRVKRCIPPSVSYSCHFWASHLAEMESGFDAKVMGGLRCFMHNQFLFWLEVLSLTQGANLASSMLLLAVEWIPVSISCLNFLVLENRGADQPHQPSDQDYELARDMWKFTAGFASVISQSVPHIYLSALAFSPQSSALSKMYRKQFPQTLHAQTGGLGNWPALQNVIFGHSGWVTSVAFSPDGRHIVSGSGDKTIRVWDAEIGAMVVGPLEGHSSWVTSVAFSPDGTHIVSGSGDRTIRLWDAKTGDMVIPPLEAHTSYVTSVAFSPDGKHIVSGSWDKTIRVWGPEEGVMIARSFEGHSSSVTSVAFSPDGSHIVSSSEDKTIRVWDVKTGVTVVGPFGGSNWVTSVAFSPDGEKIASGSWDKKVQVWSARTGEITSDPFEGHHSWVTSVAFSPDGRYIASGSWDRTIHVWDAETGATVIGPFEGHNNSVTSVTFSPDGRRIVSGSGDMTVQVWDAETGAMTSGCSKGHNDWVTSVAFLPDGKQIVSGSGDKTIQLWDAERGAMVGEPFKGHDNWVTSVALSPDGKQIVSGSGDKTIGVWDIKTGTMVVGPLKGHTTYVTSVAFSPDGRCIVSGSWDETIIVWDAETGSKIKGPLKGHHSSITSVKFSPDGQHIVSGSEDKKIILWDAKTLTPKPFAEQENWVTSVAFSPDGRQIASGSWDSKIRVWGTETRTIINKPLEGHSSWITSVAFSPDGKQLVSGSWDQTIRVWGVETGEMIMGPFRGHSNSVTSVKFSLDGGCIVSGSGDKTIRVWNIKSLEVQYIHAVFP